MCQCGCGERENVEAYRIKGAKTVIAYKIFPGCRECDYYGPGITINVYDSPKSEWLRWTKVQEIEPDEYGGFQGQGISFGLFDQEDLRAAARELWSEAAIGPGMDQYANLDDWLHDYGQQLVADAIYRYAERMAAERAMAQKARRKRQEQER